MPQRLKEDQKWSSFFIKKEETMSVYIAASIVGTLWTVAGAAMALETFRD